MHKPIIRKFKKWKVHSLLKTIFGAQIWQIWNWYANLIHEFVVYYIDIFSKHAWVIPLKGKNGIIITNAFQKILDESNCKPNIMWVDKGSEIYIRSMKSWLEKTAIEMHSKHNEGKSAGAERFTITLKKRIRKKESIWLQYQKICLLIIQMI